MAGAIVVFSGGPDSTAAALWGVAEGFDVELLTFQYRDPGQAGEIQAAARVAALLNLKHTVLDFRSPMKSFPGVVHILMHAGTPPAQAGTPTAHRLPFGAGMVLSVAAAYATYNRVYELIWGATLDDGGAGRDYTSTFADSVSTLVAMCIGQPFHIHTPFAARHKFEAMGVFANQPRMFAETWSCKDADTVQCGTCHACVARRADAAMTGLTDLTTYTAQAFQNPLTKGSQPSAAELARLFGSNSWPYGA